jgi:hypothetical protein
MIEHEGGFQEIVVGRHAGQRQDGATLSLFTAPGLTTLWPSLAEARVAAAPDAPPA